MSVSGKPGRTPIRFFISHLRLSPSDQTGEPRKTTLTAKDKENRSKPFSRSFTEND